jgi:hydrogenase nickel incorporation protein HypB
MLKLEKTQTIHHQHEHILPDGTIVKHSHDRALSSHHHPEDNSSKIHAQIHGRTINLEQEILGKNNQIAAQNRAWFKGRKILALNFVSSPGSGKTTLLTRTINDLKTKIPISVIEGDQATIHDADRIRETGCKAIQINTGQGCHLEAEMIEKVAKNSTPLFILWLPLKM